MIEWLNPYLCTIYLDWFQIEIIEKVYLGIHCKENLKVKTDWFLFNRLNLSKKVTKLLYLKQNLA